MFERFTEQARRVVVLAQEEARLLDQNYIGTEHILLGLLHEGVGIAARVFGTLDVSLELVRNKAVEIIDHSGVSSPMGHIQFSSRAKEVLELSLQEASRLGHDHIGAEHLLLGLLQQASNGEGGAARVLEALSVPRDALWDRTLQLVSQSTSDTHEVNTRSGIGRVMARSRQEAVDIGQDYIGTEHFLLGLLCEEDIADGLAEQVSADAVRHAIVEMLRDR